MKPVQHAAERYNAERFGRPHPIPLKEKGPRVNGWQDPNKVFAPEAFTENVGTMLVGDLANVDCDCSEAVKAAPRLLPDTHRKHSRPGRGGVSHLWYRSEGLTLTQFRDIKKIDPEDGKPKEKMLIELRTGVGKQTLLPPSIHPSGEQLEWIEDGEPARVDGPGLLDSVRLVAVVALVVRNYVDSGRHDGFLALAGFLAHAGVKELDARHALEEITRQAEGGVWSECQKSVEDTYEKFGEGKKVLGAGDTTAEAKGLTKWLGTNVVNRLREWFKVESVVELREVDPNELARPVAEPYKFEPAFGPGHLVTEWIDHFSAQCDAPLEYHEAAALTALSMVTHDLKLWVSGGIEPLRTNLFVVFIGPSTASRKSTSKDYATNIAKRMPDLCRVLPEMASHEGMVEALSDASGKAALMSVDELKPLLDKLTHAQHLAGLKGLILEMYGRTNYVYKRVSKKMKSKDGDAEHVEDGFSVLDVTFSILGCCTESVFDRLTSEIIESGLMPRFAIVWPTGKPKRMPRFQLTLKREPTALVARLHDIAKRAAKSSVRCASGVLELLDQEVDLPIEQDADAGLMVKRLPGMALKVAMLSAAGRADAFEATVLLEESFRNPPPVGITITVDDAQSAIAVVRRWRAGAMRFEEQLGTTEFERKVERCLTMVKGRQGHVNRREIARRVKMSAKDMREVEETLKQRGHIDVVVQNHAKGAPPKVLWKWLG